MALNTAAFLSSVDEWTSPAGTFQTHRRTRVWLRVFVAHYLHQGKSILHLIVQVKRREQKQEKWMSWCPDWRLCGWPRGLRPDVQWLTHRVCTVPSLACTSLLFTCLFSVEHGPVCFKMLLISCDVSFSSNSVGTECRRPGTKLCGAAGKQLPQRTLCCFLASHLRQFVPSQTPDGAVDCAAAFSLLTATLHVCYELLCNEVVKSWMQLPSPSCLWLCWASRQRVTSIRWLMTLCGGQELINSVLLKLAAPPSHLWCIRGFVRGFIPQLLCFLYNL